jgi:hypothetical protein
LRREDEGEAMIEQKERICPLAISGLFGPPRGGQAVVTCLMERCAAWDEYYHNCGMVSAPILYDIKTSLDMIKSVLENIGCKV